MINNQLDLEVYIVFYGEEYTDQNHMGGVFYSMKLAEKWINDNRDTMNSYLKNGFKYRFNIITTSVN